VHSASTGFIEKKKLCSFDFFTQGEKKEKKEKWVGKAVVAQTKKDILSHISLTAELRVSSDVDLKTICK
jgi:hypothetical protein